MEIAIIIGALGVLVLVGVVWPVRSYQNRRYCIHCRFLYRPGQRRCRNCGNPLPPMQLARLQDARRGGFFVWLWRLLKYYTHRRADMPAIPQRRTRTSIVQDTEGSRAAPTTVVVPRTTSPLRPSTSDEANQSTLATTCPSCHYPLDPGARFCGQCGRRCT